MDSSYGGFSRIYDEHMRFVPYDRWIEYVERMARLLGRSPGSVVDLGTGTGNTALPWARKGMRVVGVDSSEGMLRQAAAKAETEGLSLTLLCQDIRHFQLEEPVELATCLYDTVNYLLEPDSVSQFFDSVKRNLVPGGLFIFDVNSYHKLSSIKSDTFHFREDSYHLVWDQEFLEEEALWITKLTGFIREEDGRYSLFQEEHRERAYRRLEILDLLSQAGLRSLACYRAYSFEPPSPTDDRFFFAAEKGE